MAQVEVVVFDVNETLLDLRAMTPRLESVLPEGASGLWFSTFLRSSLVGTVTGRYAPFKAHGVEALVSVASAYGKPIDHQVAEGILDEMTRLPPHPDVIPALEHLRAAGFRLATLTNSDRATLTRQIENAGLTPFFDQLISVEAVARFKPARETYSYAAAQLDVRIGDMRLVAAHDWDVTGAIRAGAKAAFVARSGQRLGALSEEPDIVESDLVAVAEAIVASANPGADV